MATTGPGINGPMTAGAFMGFGLINTDSLVLGQERAIVINNVDGSITINGGYAGGETLTVSALGNTDNMLPIAVDDPILFPNDTYTVRAGGITRVSSSITNLEAAGTYQVSWSVPVDEASAQLVLAVIAGGVSGVVGPLPAKILSSVAGRAGTGSQIRGNITITTTLANTQIQLQNGASTIGAITVTKLPAGNVSTLTITRVD